MSKIKSYFKLITIEPMLLLFYIAYDGLINVVENFRLERYCRVSLDRGDDCDSLGDGNDEDLEVEVQKLENQFMVYESYIGSILPVLLLLYLAAWSDKHGRRAPMVLSLVGWALYAAVYLLASLFPSWSAWMLLTASFLRSLGGGHWILMMATYAFITDITTPEDRLTRMSLLMAIKGIGMSSGTALGPIIRDSAGYTALYAIATIIFIICIIMACLIMPHKSGDSDKSRLQRIMSVPRKIKINFLDLLKTAVKKREGYTRFFINYLSMLMLIQLVGQTKKMFLWSRIVLKWDLNQYSLYSTTNQIMGTIGVFVCTPLIKYFRIHDCIFGAVLSLFCFCKTLAFGLLTDPSQWWVLYMFTWVPVYNVSVTIRSLMSKQGGSAEVGRIMALIAIWENILPVFENTMYGAIYGATVDTYPSTIHLVESGFNLVAFASFLGMHLLMRSQEQIPYQKTDI